MRNFFDKHRKGNQNTPSNNFFSENGAIYEIMWKNVVQQGRPQMTIRHMYIAYWITKDGRTDARKTQTNM